MVVARAGLRTARTRRLLLPREGPVALRGRRRRSVLRRRALDRHRLRAVPLRAAQRPRVRPVRAEVRLARDHRRADVPQRGRRAHLPAGRRGSPVRELLLRVGAGGVAPPARGHARAVRGRLGVRRGPGLALARRREDLRALVRRAPRHAREHPRRAPGRHRADGGRDGDGRVGTRRRGRGTLGGRVERRGARDQLVLRCRVSGYAGDPRIDNRGPRAGDAFLAKPFAAEELERAVATLFAR